MSNRCIAFGALLIFGTYMSAYTVIAGIFVIWAIWITWETKRSPPKLALLLVASIYVSAIGSISPTLTIALGTIVLSLFVIGRFVRSGWDIHAFLIGLFIGASMQMFAAVLTWGDPRPPLLSLNASQLAQTGLVFWLVIPELPRSKQWYGWLPAAIQISVSMSRAPIASVMLYFFARPSKQFGFMLVALISVFIFAGHSQGNLNRFMPDTVKEAAESRIALLGFPGIQLQSIAVDIPTAAEVTKRLDPDHEVVRTSSDLLTGTNVSEVPITEETAFWATGYGLGNYINVTGLVRPHNIFALLYWEMGALSIVPALLFGWAVFTRRIPVSVFLALILLWQFTEEAAGRVEGFFTTTAVLVAVWRSRPATNSLLAATRRRLLPAIQLSQ